MEELQKEQNAVPEAEEAPEIVLDELILSDNTAWSFWITAEEPMRPAWKRRCMDFWNRC